MSRPLGSERAAPVARLRAVPALRADDPESTPSFGLADAESLVPPMVLRGCREAAQRLGTAEMPMYGISSAIRGEGRSSIALGVAAAECLDRQRRTVLVDLDLEAPSLHRRLGLAEAPRLDDALHDSINIEDHLQRFRGDLWLLAAWQTAGDAPRTLNRLAHSTLMSQLQEWAEAIVFDLPPVLGSSSGVEASRFCTAPVLVVRAGVTPLPQVRDAVDVLGSRPSVILNGVTSRVPPWLRRALGDWT